MSNPWENINLSDYENHMSLDSVYQLQSLSEMMGEQFYTYDVNSIMILGIAGGNGLEHIDKTRIHKVYGVDVNKDFLDECKARYTKLEGVFEPIHADLLSESAADIGNDHVQHSLADRLLRLLAISYQKRRKPSTGFLLFVFLGVRTWV